MRLDLALQHRDRTLHPEAQRLFVRDTISPLSQWIAALMTLARNAVPLAGVLLRDWAAPGALLLYLGENVILVLLAACTVRLVAPTDEVIEGERKTRRDALRTFALIAAPFTFGAAAITAGVLFIRSDYAFDVRELLAGLATMAVLQLLAFASNIRRLRGVSLAESETMLVSVLGRVFLLAFAVWAGLIVALFVSSAFVVPFMLLKTLIDLWNLRPESLKRRLVRAM